MIDITTANSNNIYLSSFFDLNFDPKIYPLNLQMKLAIPIFNTKLLPLTRPILSQNLPTIFQQKCFNNLNRSFKEESKQTEIGHLFEHIVLEYLCLLKSKDCQSNFKISGETAWDWVREAPGSFHITFDLSPADNVLFLPALYKSTILLNKILASSHLTHSFNLQSNFPEIN